MFHDLVARQAEFSSKRLTLRPIKASDAANVSRFGSDRRIAEMTPMIPFPISRESADGFIMAALAEDRSTDVWVIDGSPSGEMPFLGLMSLKYLDRKQSEVGYWVAPEYWSRGFASEALAALIETNPHANASVVASVFQDNPASARVLAANRFVHLGSAEAFCLARGKHVPTWTYLRTL